MDLDLSEDLKKYDEIIRFTSKLVSGMIDRSDINTILISGPPGIGKTYNVDKILTKRSESVENPIRYAKYRGHVTPRAFFNELKDNSSSDSVLLFDDANTVITNPDSLELLKAASETNGKRRTVNWLSTATRENGFDFEGKLIIITNIAVSDDPNLEAVRDRFHTFDMQVTYRMKLAKIQDIANLTSDPAELELNKQIVEFLYSKGKEIDNDKVSIRTFSKLKSIAKLMPEWQRFAEISGTYFERPKLVKQKAGTRLV